MDVVASPPVRDWSLIILKVDGHGLAAEMRDSMAALDRVGSSSSAYISVRAEKDHFISDYTVADVAGAKHHLQLTPGGRHHVSTKQEPMLAESSMEQFLVDTMRRCPARHYLVSFEGHSRQLRKVIGPMHQALAAAAQANGGKLDVLALDSCFMAQLETANEFADVAHVLVGSQEYMAGWRQLEQVAQMLPQHPMDAHEMGRTLVGLSTDNTLSALDLDKIDGVNAHMKTLADQISQTNDVASLKHIRQDVADSQHFYVEGSSRWKTWHNTVDVADATNRLANDDALEQKQPELVAAARAVAVAVAPAPDGFVFAENHTPIVHRRGLDYYDVRAAHGVSVHMPTTASILRSGYTHFKNSKFDQATGWDGAMHHLTSEKGVGFVARSLYSNLTGLGVHLINGTITGLREFGSRVNDALHRRGAGK